MKSNKELYKDLLKSYYDGVETIEEMLNAVQPYIRTMPKECFNIFYNDLLEKANPKQEPEPEIKKTPKVVREEKNKPTILSDIANGK